MSRVCLIVADSLRWDYTSVMMFNELFDEESWTKLDTPDTYTAACMPTLLTGDNSHGNTDFLRRVISSDSLLHDRDTVMWSHTFGNEKSMLKWGEQDQFDIRGFEEKDELEIVDWINESESDELPELIVYHSMITHWPFGKYPDENFVDGIYVEDKREYEWSRENYRKGVRDMKFRVNSIRRRLPDDYTIVLTSDHGEGLGENGVTGHIEDIDTGVADWVHHPEQVSEDVSWKGVGLSPFTSEVPFVVNDENVDPTVMKNLRNVRGMVEALLDDDDEYQALYDVDFEIEFLGDEYTDMESVMKQLEDLGYK